MGVFNRAIPTLTTNRLNQVRVQPEEYYVDDIFDPLFNEHVREQLTLKYGNPILGTFGGYVEGIDNTLIGQKDQWGILGPGMGILSGFGRSMDKAGDFIIGGLTEGVKFATGQGFESPIRNIFVEDEDYSGARLLAAMGNSMAKIADAPTLSESDFTGMWNIPGTVLDLMTDPGILGGSLSRAATPVDLAKQVGKQQVNQNLADVGQLLSDYDDIMAKVSMDITAPGLRQGIGALIDKIQQRLATSSHRPLANTVLNSKEDPNVRIKGQDRLRKDMTTRELLDRAERLQKAYNEVSAAESLVSKNFFDVNSAQIGVGVATSVPTAIKEELTKAESPVFENENSRIVRYFTRAIEENIPERVSRQINADRNSETLITELHDIIRRDDLRNATRENDEFEHLLAQAGVSSNTDLHAAMQESALSDRSQQERFLDDYRKISSAAYDIRNMDEADLEYYGINPEYAHLELFGGPSPAELEEYLTLRTEVQGTPHTPEAKVSDSEFDNLIQNNESFARFKDTHNYYENVISKGLFYETTKNSATQNALYRYAGIDPKSQKMLQLETPVTLSPTEYAGRSSESYRAAVQAGHTILKEAFDRAGHPISAIQKVSQIDDMYKSNIFKRLLPNDNDRQNAVSLIRTLFAPQTVLDGKVTTHKYIRALRDFVDIIQNKIGITNAESESLLATVSDIADSTGKPVSEILNDTKESYTLVPWATLRYRRSTGVGTSEYLDDLNVCNNVFNLENPKNTHGVLKRFSTIHTKESLIKTDVEKAHFFKISRAKRNLEDAYKALQTRKDNLNSVRYAAMRKYTGHVVSPYTEFPEALFEHALKGIESEIPILKQKYDDALVRYELALAEQESAVTEAISKYRKSLTPADKRALTIVSKLPLHDPSNVIRVLKDADDYHTFWNNMITTYYSKIEGPEQELYQSLIEAAETVKKDVLDPMERKQSIVYDINPLQYRSGDSPKVYKLDYSKDSASKQYGTRKFRESSASGVMSYQYHPVYNNFFRLNSRLFDDPKHFDTLIHHTLPTLAKHYQVKLKPEFFTQNNQLISTVRNGTVSGRLKNLIRVGDAYVDEFNSIFTEDVKFLVKNGIDPRTSISKFKHYSNNTEIYDALVRVQSALGKVNGALTPENYKAFNYLFKKNFPIEYVPVEGKMRPRFVHYTSEGKVYSLEPPVVQHTVSDYVEAVNANIAADYVPEAKVYSTREKLINVQSPTDVDSTKNIFATNVADEVVKTVQEAPVDEATEVIVDFPTHTESVETKLIEEFNLQGPAEMSKGDFEAFATQKAKKPSPPETPTPSETRKILYPKSTVDLFDKIHEAVVAASRSSKGDKATLRTKYVKSILDDADLLMTREGVTEADIAEFKRMQIYLNGAQVRKEEFLDTLASSGMFQMAYKPSEDFTNTYNQIVRNVSEINVAMKANVLKPFKFKLSNGNIVIGAMWDPSVKNIVGVIERGYSKVNISKLSDIVRLNPGSLSSSVLEYVSSEKYRKINDLFDRVRKSESEYAKMLGFTYDDVRHVKNVRNISPDVGNYLANIVYKDLPVDDLDELSDTLMGLPIFKHLRGAWGTRMYDKRFVGYIEDFEAEGLRIFADDASKIVKGSLGEGSFNNAKFQLYVDLFENDNFTIRQYASTPEDLERIFYAKLPDGSPSGNLHNLVLVAPRKDASGRVIGFKQFDKTARAGLQQALCTPGTVLLPAHVLGPLDRVLRKDAKMSNKVYAFINKHLTLPFKFGVLMNPGFLLGNANDAYLKQATTMAHKYGTSVAEELANVSVAMRDVIVLNNTFDDAYRKFLTHIQAEGFPIAPSNHISELAASDPRVRKMLKAYVDGTLQKGIGRPLIDCKLSKAECDSVKLWLMLNSPSTSAAFDKGLQDVDDVARAMNASKFQPSKNIVDRVLTGKGQYVASDVSTWGLFINNPLSRKIMETSEGIENIFRSAAILNDFRHKGMSPEWFSEYFKDLSELKTASKSDPESLAMLEALKKKFSVDMTDSLNTMHNANFDYERMNDFTDTVGTFVPFPTFFLKNLGYWLEVLVEHPQYIDHAISIQEGLWKDREEDTKTDSFAAEAKGRGAVPLPADGQKLSNLFKGIFKPTPLQSMFGAFSLLNNPVEDMYYRLHPVVSGAAVTATELSPDLKSIAAKALPQEDVKYRPYSTDMYERNITQEDPNFNPLAYAIHRLNPVERSMQAALRLPDKLRQDEAQLADFAPSIFQPDF